MKPTSKIALMKALLMGIMPEKERNAMTYDEDEANRAIAEGRLNPYEIQKKADEAMKPLIQAEVRKRTTVVYYIDENGQIRRKKVPLEENE